MTDDSWAATHCYLCGTELPARQIELVRKLFADELTEPEERELEALDCPNGCWTKEERAQRELNAARVRDT